VEESKLAKLEEQLLAICKEKFSADEIAKIKKAIDFASAAHEGTLRQSGEPYLIHPLSVAIKIAELKLDHQTIIAALLHDTVEDTSVTLGDIKKNFSSEIANLVESVTKLSNIKIKMTWFPMIRSEKIQIPQFERQVETLRKMLIAMSKDVRVIFIKLADKLHNLETLEYLPKEKQERIAKESIEIYAPIAGRLGMGEWRGNLEDLAFPFVNKEAFDEIKSLAVPEIKDREKYLIKITKKLKEILTKNRIKADINFRAKKWYSLYRKLIKYNNDLDKVYDLIAVRVIVDSIEDCYAVLGLIHNAWRPLPGRIKDYIAIPKPNGYQSIHTTVFSDDKQIVEFQIRTKKMHQQAEFGIASHWIYADKKSSKLPNKDDLRWIDDFYKIQKKISSPEELVRTLKMDFFEDRIFVFTPDGDVKDLPYGATPVDFAYYVHTDLGNKCSGAKINGKIAPLSTILHNGDIVEIIKKENAKPHADWLNFTKTDIARSQIKRKTHRGL
jgi:GTP pyrophosphokinase